MVLESVIERALVNGLKARGAMCVKQEATMAGLPDRLCVLPGGRVVWVELKQDKGRLRPIQAYMHRRLRKLGHDVRTLYGMEQVLDFLEGIDEVQSK